MSVRLNKRSDIKKLGADLILSGRTIQFTHVKYLVPIEKQYPELKCQLDSARTAPLQRKNDPKGSIISSWCAVSKSLRTSLWGG